LKNFLIRFKIRQNIDNVYRQRLEPTFPKNQLASQLAPMVACILLFFSLKNKRYCQPAGKWIAEKSLTIRS